jgi:hypothetical protein
MPLDSEPIGQNDSTHHAEGKPSKQADNPDIPITPTSAPTPQRQPPKTHCEITCKAENNWWDKTKPFVELVGVLLLLVYTIYTIKMYHANKKSADAAKSAAETARDALIVDHRPWIGPDTGFPSVKVRIDHDRIFLDTEMRVRNYGNSPALHFTEQPPWPEPIESGVLAKLTAGMKNACEQTERMMTSEPTHGGALFPNNVATLFSTWPWGQVGLDKRFVITSCVVYMSQFTGDRIHHTALCLQSLATVRDFLDKKATPENALVSCNRGAYITD